MCQINSLIPDGLNKINSTLKKSDCPVPPTLKIWCLILRSKIENITKVH